MSETPKGVRRDTVEKKRDTTGPIKKPASRVSLLQKKGSAIVDKSSGAAVSTEELPQLYLKVECGKDFPSNLTGFLYCTLNLEGLSEQSNYVIACAEPRWNDEFVLHVKQKMSCVEVTFYLVDEEGVETSFLGEINIPIHTLLSHKVLSESFPLSSQTTGAATQGEVQIVLYNSLQKSSMDALRELDEIYSSFLNLLKDNMPLLASLFDCIDASDADRVGASVVSIFNFLRKEVDLFEWVIRLEVESTASMSVLFRSNSMAIRLVSLFAKLTASSYLKWLLLPLIEETVSGDCSRFEVDSSRLTGAATIKKNQKNLQELVDKFLNAILGSVERIPRTLRLVCALFVNLVEGKFPGGSSRAVGGFFFLRFVCPAIVAPASFGLLQKHPTGPAHRALVLVAKVLQNISNQTQFKEAEMEPFNDYLASRQGEVTNFLKAVATVTSTTGEGESLQAVKPGAVADSCVIIAKLLRQNAARIKAVWEDDEELSTTVLDELDRVLVELAASEQVHEKPYNAPLVEAQLRKDGIVKLPQVQEGPSLAHDEDESDSILNISRPWPKPLRPGAAKDMVSMAMALYLDECNKASKAKAVDWVSVCGAKGAASAEFKRLELAVCELQRTDFRHMLSLPQKYAFWLNVYHTLLFHVLFTVGFPNSSHAKKIFYSNFRYRVGSFTLSLSDIEHGVLRGNLPNKSGQRQWADTDKRRQLCLPKEMGVLYALSNLTATSPVVVAYGMQLEKQLGAVLTHFLNAVVEIDVVRKEVMLPKQFSRFAADSASLTPGDKAKDPNKVLLSWLYNYLTARKKLDILYLQGKTCSVHVAKKTGKMMTPKVTVDYFSKFDRSGEARAEELPEMFQQGTLRLRTETAPVAPRPRLAELAGTSGSHSSQALQASSPVTSAPGSPPPETVEEFGSPRVPRAAAAASSAAAAAAAAAGSGSGLVALPERGAMVRQSSALNENIMRESLSTMVQQVTSELFDSQTLAQTIYTQVCRTVSVTTAFNTGKIIREVKVSLLELQGISWTAESLERFKQNFQLETPELTRLQIMQVSEAKQQQLLKLLTAIQTAVLDIRFLLENVVSFLNKDPTRAVQLSRVVPALKARLQWVLERVQEKNAETAPLEELVTLEGAISPEIDSLVSLLAAVKEQLGAIDLGNSEGRLSLLAFAAILAWVKTQLDSPKALAPFKPQTWDKHQVEELTLAKLGEIMQVLRSLIDSVTRRLVAIQARLLIDATHEKLYEVADIIRNCRDALMSSASF